MGASNTHPTKVQSTLSTTIPRRFPTPVATTATKEQELGLLSLPNEVIVHIFGFCDLISWIFSIRNFNLSLICKRLFNLFWCNFTRLLISSDQIFDVFDRLVEKDIVTSLEIAPRLLGSLWDDRRSSVRHHGPDPHVERQRALERERLCQRLAHRFLSGIVQSPPSFPSLRSVSLSSLEFANYMPDLSPLATLQHLNHLSLSVENANNTDRISSSTPRLSAFYEGLAKCTTLQELTLRFSNYNWHHPSLQFKSNNESLLKLTTLTQLTSLTYSISCVDLYEGLPSWSNLTIQCRGLSNLRSLSFDFQPGEQGPYDVAGIVSKLTLLETLRARCDSLPIPRLSTLQQLKSLHITHSPLCLEPNTMKYFPNLKIMSIAYNGPYRSDVKFLASSPSLKRLDISGTTGGPVEDLLALGPLRLLHLALTVRQYSWQELKTICETLQCYDVAAYFGQSILQLAIENNDEAFIRQFAAVRKWPDGELCGRTVHLHGFDDLDRRGETALQQAMKLPSRAMADLLVELGATR